jgi:membrane protein
MIQAADENNLPFLASALSFGALLAAVPFVLLLLVALSTFATGLGGEGVPDLGRLLDEFLPPHQGAGGDPFAGVEAIVGRIGEHRGTVSLVAVPLFIWLSTRLFAGVRTALNEIYDVAARPGPRRHFLATYLRGKLRDAAMVVLVLALFLANSAMSLALGVAVARGEALAPGHGFLFTSLGRWLAQLLAFGFAVSLFYVVYRHASAQRVRRVPALVASLFSALLYELAKRLFALYFLRVAASERFSLDANLGAVILFVLWVFYTAFVFLLGGVLAQIWELRSRTERQRARFG